MVRSKRGAFAGQDGKDGTRRSARLDSVLQSIEADLKELLERWVPRLEELGYFSDPAEAGLKVLTQVEVRPPYVCIVSLCSQEPLERLSPRERQVMRLVRRGRSTKEIATELEIKPRTVETYIRRVYGKLDVHSRVLLSQQARLLG